MNKIETAIHEIHHMDYMAGKDDWLNEVHPLVKLVLTIAFIAFTVSFNKYDIAGVCSMAVYPIALFILGDLSFKTCLKRIKVVLPLVIFIGIFNPFFDKVPVMVLGITMRAGWISMITLMLKGVLAVLASYILIATTGIEKICYALRCLHVPKILVTEFMLIYRYIILFMKEVNSVMSAYMLRAPGQKGINIKAWGPLAGQLLIRSMDRANIVYESMSLRGYNGEFLYMGDRVKFSEGDIILLAAFLAIFIIFRINPIFLIAGGLIS